MKIVLHTGAHRTATTSFQSFLWDNRRNLAQVGVTTWTPRRTRDGLMAAMMKHPALITLPDEICAQRSVGRVRVEAERLRRAGQKILLVSEENMLGTAMNNLADRRLYPLLQERMRRFHDAFAGAPLRVCLSIRSYDTYWTSILAFALLRGHPVPGPDLLDCLVTQPRRWRDVIRDLAVSMPGAEIVVWPFERAAGQNAFQLQAATGLVLPDLADKDDWDNRTGLLHALEQLVALRGETLTHGRLHDPLARWAPFAEDHLSTLRAEYRRDLAWLEAGAEGFATYFDGRTTPADGPDRGPHMTARTSKGDGPTGGHIYGVEERLG